MDIIRMGPPIVVHMRQLKKEEVLQLQQIMEDLRSRFQQILEDPRRQYLFIPGFHKEESLEDVLLEEDPDTSCVSIKSDRSKDFPLSFKRQHSETEQNRPDSPERSCVSMKSDQSKDFPLSFNPQHSKETSDGSTDPRSALDSIFMCLQENIVGFVKKELKKFKKMLSPDYPECPEDQCGDEGVVDEEEAQRRYSSKLVLDMTLLFMRRMNLGELAASLEKRSKRLLESVAKNTKQNAAFPGLISAISMVFSTCFR
ncbi:uncharacterized protein AB9X84_024057 isoform 1-T2 [Acanthopagrus schlegelii]